MSRENVEFAKSVFSRWNAGERRFPDEEIHPEAVVVSRILGQAVRGRDGVRRYVREIHRMYEAFNRQDFDVAVEFAHPDIAFVAPGDQPAYRGVESFRRWMEPDAFSEQVLEAPGVPDLGQQDPREAAFEGSG